MSNMNVLMHNMQSMFTNRQLGITNNNRTKSSEKLSSGYRINRAADDAAGLTISEKMRSQIRGLHQGSKNIQDGISVVQVADGAMEEITDCLQRINELTIKAYNDTNTEQDRQAMQSEIDNCRGEIQRIVDSTTFNEIPVLKFDRVKEVLDVPAHKEPGYINTTEIRNIPEWVSCSKKMSKNNYVPGTEQDTNVWYVNASNNPVKYYGPSVAEKVICDGIEFDLGNKRSLAVKDEEGHFIPDDEIVVEYGGAFTPSLADNACAVVDFGGLSESVNTAEELYEEMTGLIGSSIGCLCSTCDDKYYGITFLGSEPEFKVEDTKSIIYMNQGHASESTINLSTWKPFDSGTKSVFDQVRDLISDHKNSEKTDEEKKQEVKELANEIEKALAQKSYQAINQTCLGNSHFNRVLKKDDTSWVLYDYRDWNVMTTPSEKDVQTSSVVHGMTEVEIDVPDSYRTEHEDLIIQASGRVPDEIPIRLPYIDVDSLFDGEYSVARYKETRYLSENYLKKLKEWEDSAVLEPYSVTYPAVEASTKTYTQNIYETVTGTDGNGEAYKTRKITGTTEITVNIPGRPAYTVTGVTKAYPYSKPQPGPDDYVSVKEYDPSNVQTILDAIGKISDFRSQLGADQNRLESAYRNNQNKEENTTAAESRIRDTDMAEEISRFTKDGILQQAGQSMLAQANQNRQGILSLLQ